jgi:DNA-binding IclR family transcriptional regulator
VGAAATAGSVLLAAAGPVVRGLRDDTGETTVLFVRQDAQRVIVYVAESRPSIVFRGAVGEAMPLAAGAAGKVFMAWDPVALERAKDLGLQRLTPGTIVGEVVLIAVIALVPTMLLLRLEHRVAARFAGREVIDEPAV